MSVITQAPIIMLTAEDVEKGRMRGNTLYEFNEDVDKEISALRLDEKKKNEEPIGCWDIFINSLIEVFDSCLK